MYGHSYVCFTHLYVFNLHYVSLHLLLALVHFTVERLRYREVRLHAYGSLVESGDGGIQTLVVWLKSLHSYS